MIRMQEYIEAHLTENITAKGVAERLGLNYQTVHVQFREFFGVGIGEYISDRRMERAATELAGGAQVSMLLQKYHYATHSAFARAFRKHFGISAREYRNGVEPRRRSAAEPVQELRRNPELYRQSSEYLELAFKAKHGVSPTEYVENKRKQKAAAVLRQAVLKGVNNSVKRPEDLTFEKYQLDPMQAMVRGLRYVDPRLIKMRDYIIEHIDEDLTPHSVIDPYGMPYNNTRYMFHSVMGESVEHMIRRLKQERAEKTAQDETSS
jgi:AraC-like DNA-binding protein